MPEVQPSPRVHTPQMLAAELLIGERWARKLCRRMLGRRTRYRLTETERERVVAEFYRWSRLAQTAVRLESRVAPGESRESDSVSVPFVESPSSP